MSKKQISIRLDDREFQELAALVQAKSQLEGKIYSLPEFVKSVLLKELQANRSLVNAALAANAAWRKAFSETAPTVSVDEPAADDSDAVPEPAPASEAQKKACH